MGTTLWRSFLAAALLALVVSCADRPVGTKQRPFTMYFVPSMQAQDLGSNSDTLAAFVSKFVSQRLYGEDRGFYVRTRIPMSYVAVVEALGTGRADLAALNTFSFVLAKDIKGYDVEALLAVVRGVDERTYCGQILVRADSGIETLGDLNGKSFAYTDPSSSAGFMLPVRLFEREGVRLGNTVFATRHDSVVSMVHQGQVDAGATYFSPPRLAPDGTVLEHRDARARVLTQYPDVFEKVRILAFTEHVPNEPWVVRGTLDPEPGRNGAIKDAVRDALVAFAKTPEGRESLEGLYNLSGLAPVEDSEYDGMREMVLRSGADIEAQLAGRR